jgi:predicted regulator of Ras-like GTPase activity (Roadblock/LC7/MglB family)
MAGLKEVIARWPTNGMVEAAAVVNEDGLLVHDALNRGTDAAEAVAALTVELLRHARQLADAGARGALHAMVMEVDEGPVIVQPLDARHTLVIFAAAEQDLGPLLFDLRMHRDALRATI